MLSTGSFNPRFSTYMLVTRPRAILRLTDRRSTTKMANAITNARMNLSPPILLKNWNVEMMDGTPGFGVTSSFCVGPGLRIYSFTEGTGGAPWVARGVCLQRVHSRRKTWLVPSWELASPPGVTPGRIEPLALWLNFFPKRKFCPPRDVDFSCTRCPTESVL